MLWVKYSPYVHFTREKMKVQNSSAISSSPHTQEGAELGPEPTVCQAPLCHTATQLSKETSRPKLSHGHLGTGIMPVVQEVDGFVVVVIVVV